MLRKVFFSEETLLGTVRYVDEAEDEQQEMELHAGMGLMVTHNYNKELQVVSGAEVTVEDNRWRKNHVRLASGPPYQLWALAVDCGQPGFQIGSAFAITVPQSTRSHFESSRFVIVWQTDAKRPRVHGPESRSCSCLASYIGGTSGPMLPTPDRNEKNMFFFRRLQPENLVMVFRINCGRHGQRRQKKTHTHTHQKRVQKGLEGLGKFRKGSESVKDFGDATERKGFGRFGRVPKGSEKVREASEGFGRFFKSSGECTKRVWKSLEVFGRVWKVSQRFRHAQKVSEGFGKVCGGRKT